MLAKPRVEHLACLLGQSLRTGRRSPSTPNPVHVDTKLCVCVCVCVCVSVRGMVRAKSARICVCSKRAPVMRANRAQGACERAARRRAGRDRVGLEGMESGRDCNQVF